MQIKVAGKDYAARVRACNRTLGIIREDPSLQLTPVEAQSPLISGAGPLMTPGEAHREKNLQTLSLLAKAAQAGEDPSPPETYQGVRELIAPRVQEILECNVEALQALSPQALVAELDLIIDLSMGSETVERLLKLAAPTQQSSFSAPPTLYDDLVGQNDMFFTYKVTVLRGLTQKARGLALLAQSRKEALSPDCFTEEERQQLGEVPEAFLAEQVAQGEALVAQAHEQLNAPTS